MHKLFNELGLSILTAICSIIVTDIFIKYVDFGEIILVWLKRLV